MAPNSTGGLRSTAGERNSDHEPHDHPPLNRLEIELGLENRRTGGKLGVSNGHFSAWAEFWPAYLLVTFGTVLVLGFSSPNLTWSVLISDPSDFIVQVGGVILLQFLATFMGGLLVWGACYLVLPNRISYYDTVILVAVLFVITLALTDAAKVIEIVNEIGPTGEVVLT